MAGIDFPTRTYIEPQTRTYTPTHTHTHPQKSSVRAVAGALIIKINDFVDGESGGEWADSQHTGFGRRFSTVWVQISFGQARLRVERNSSGRHVSYYCYCLVYCEGFWVYPQRYVLQVNTLSPSMCSIYLNTPTRMFVCVCDYRGLIWEIVQAHISIRYATASSSPTGDTQQINDVLVGNIILYNWANGGLAPGSLSHCRCVCAFDEHKIIAIPRRNENARTFMHTHS